MFKNLYLGMKFSFSYFSILPVTFKKSDDLSTSSILNIMLLSLPLVGWVLGFLTITLFALLSKLGWYGAIFSAVFYMLSYGFLHTEAIIDVFDAIYASHSGKNAYEIIKEPTVGAVGLLYGTVFVVLKIAGIVMLFSHNLFLEFISVLVISRLSLLTLIVIHDFKSSFVTQLKESLDIWFLALLFTLISIIGSMFLKSFLIWLIIGIILGFSISIFFVSKLRFANGDVLGATLEAVEILLFLVVAIFMV